MSDPKIRCPDCSQTGEQNCPHDQDERRELCRVMGIDPIPEDIYIASDPEAVARAAKRQKTRDKAEDSELIWLMRQPQGRRFIWRRLGLCGLYRISFNPKSPDALVTAFLEGERNTALNLLAEIVRAAPAEYLLMLKESTDAA